MGGDPMIDVEIVIAGALGEVALSMLPELAAERRLYTRLLVADQNVAGAVLSRLEAAGFEVVRVAELHPHGSRAPDG
jgi:hypothetical protein